MFIFDPNHFIPADHKTTGVVCPYADIKGLFIRAIFPHLSAHNLADGMKLSNVYMQFQSHLSAVYEEIPPSSLSADKLNEI